MDEEQRLQFEEWAEARHLPMDQHFFESGNNYIDPATRLAFDAWERATQLASES